MNKQMNRQMSNKGEDRWRQSEFWFTFVNPDKIRSASDPEEKHEEEHEYTTSMSEEVAKKHRDKLIAELHEFGC